MINSVSSMASSMQMIRNNGQQGPPRGSEGKDLFRVGDTDGDGLVSASELAILTESSELEGSSINVDEAIVAYDANQDGGLSGEELFEMLSNSGFAPPELSSGEQSGNQPPPPPPEQVSATYSQNSGEDQIAKLLELLQSSDSENKYSSINITS